MLTGSELAILLPNKNILQTIKIASLRHVLWTKCHCYDKTLIKLTRF